VQQKRGRKINSRGDYKGNSKKKKKNPKKKSYHYLLYFLEKKSRRPLPGSKTRENPQEGGAFWFFWFLLLSAGEVFSPFKKNGNKPKPPFFPLSLLNRLAPLPLKPKTWAACTQSLPLTKSKGAIPLSWSKNRENQGRPQASLSLFTKAKPGQAPPPSSKFFSYSRQPGVRLPLPHRRKRPSCPLPFYEKQRTLSVVGATRNRTETHLSLFPSTSLLDGSRKPKHGCYQRGWRPSARPASTETSQPPQTSQDNPRSRHLIQPVGSRLSSRRPAFHCSGDTATPPACRPDGNPKTSSLLVPPPATWSEGEEDRNQGRICGETDLKKKGWRGRSKKERKRCLCFSCLQVIASEERKKGGSRCGSPMLSGFVAVACEPTRRRPKGCIILFPCFRGFPALFMIYLGANFVIFGLFNVLFFLFYGFVICKCGCMKKS